MKTLNLERTKSAAGLPASPRHSQNVDTSTIAANASGAQAKPLPYDGPPWPTPLIPEAFHGLAGELVQRIEPHSEADPAALLATFLVAFGNAAGRAAHWRAEDTLHFTNEFVVIVGNSATARKGTSLDRVLSFFTDADLYWSNNCIASGLVSGEGVVHAVRDAKQNAKGETEDEGASDKRLLVTESEFASVLAAFGRKENTLSAVLRNLWDGKSLGTLTKNQGKGAEVATNPHGSIIGHITFDELKAKLTKEDLSNGVANRILWVCARRSKSLPFGGSLRAEHCPDLTAQLSARLTLAKTRGQMDFTPPAKELWAHTYEDLTRERPGTLGHVTSRAPAHVRRLAVIYALLDGNGVVDTSHLKAALAVWEYCFASAECIFGGLSATAREFHERLRLAFPRELDRTDLHNVTGRNIRAEAMTRALTELERFGLATSRGEQTGGASRQLWRATTK
jgi:hypothetical protein